MENIQDARKRLDKMQQAVVSTFTPHVDSKTRSWWPRGREVVRLEFIKSRHTRFSLIFFLTAYELQLANYSHETVSKDTPCAQSFNFWGKIGPFRIGLLAY